MTTPKQVVQFQQNERYCGACATALRCVGRGLSDPEQLKELNLHANTRILKRGQELYHEGQPAKHIVVVHSGALKAYRNVADGTQLITNFYLPGDFLGWEAMHTGRYHGNAMALNTASVCRIGIAELLSYGTGAVERLAHVLRLATEALVREEGWRVQIATKGADERVAAFLLALSAHNCGRGLSPSALALPMSRSDIGSFLNLAIETVSRVFGRFQKDGIIKTQAGMVEILDLARLNTVAGVPEQEQGPVFAAASPRIQPGAR
jgi:CRP/FNR family transcriptional regulator